MFRLRVIKNIVYIAFNSLCKRNKNLAFLNRPLEIRKLLAIFAVQHSFSLCRRAWGGVNAAS